MMKQITLTAEELQCIAEVFHEYVKEDPESEVYASIERKVEGALGKE
jgi:hypothetical protein